MRRLLVVSRRFLRPVNLDEHEPRWILAVLDDIEAGDARLLHALVGILERGCPERVDMLRLHEAVNMDDEQAVRHDGRLPPRATRGSLLSLEQSSERVAHALERDEPARVDVHVD